MSQRNKNDGGQSTSVGARMGRGSWGGMSGVESNQEHYDFETDRHILSNFLYVLIPEGNVRWVPVHRVLKGLSEITT